MKTKKSFAVTDFLWDLWCVVSIIGIWPRFIEPNLISVTKLKMNILPKFTTLKNLKIVQFSDLHFSEQMSDSFLRRLTSKILKQSPDIIVFTGDFLCYSKLVDEERLKQFLNTLHAPFGCYAVFGNHDYKSFVSINEKGEYDVIENSSSTLIKGFKRLFSTIKIQKKMTERVGSVGFHEKLKSLLEQTPFEVLHNKTKLVELPDGKLNLIGLGEYSLGRSLPETAFKNVDLSYPSLVLCHNPDCLGLLKNYPADMILSGHTHGGQVNIPLLRKKFILMENKRLVKGLVFEDNKKIYINRGIGSVMKFRWFAIPEILDLTLNFKEN